MDNKYIVTLVPLRRVDYSYIKQNASLYYENKLDDNNIINYLSDILSEKDSINVIVEKKDNKLFLDGTDFEILEDNNDSIYYGYIVTNIKSFDSFKDKKKSEGEIKKFFSDALKNKEYFENNMKIYIYNILTNRSEIVEYMKNTLRKKDVSFKWVYVYDNDNNKYDRYVLPLKKNKKNDGELVMYTSDYTDIIFFFNLNSKQSSNDNIYVDDEYILPNINDFELMGSVYDLIKNKSEIRSIIANALFYGKNNNKNK